MTPLPKSAIFGASAYLRFSAWAADINAGSRHTGTTKPVQFPRPRSPSIEGQRRHQDHAAERYVRECRRSAMQAIIEVQWGTLVGIKSAGPALVGRWLEIFGPLTN